MRNDKLLYCLFIVLFLYSFSWIFAETRVYTGSMTQAQIEVSNGYVCTLPPGVYQIDMTGSSPGSIVGPGTSPTAGVGQWVCAPDGWSGVISTTVILTEETQVYWCGAWTRFFVEGGGGSWNVTISWETIEALEIIKPGDGSTINCSVGESLTIECAGLGGTTPPSYFTVTTPFCTSGKQYAQNKQFSYTFTVTDTPGDYPCTAVYTDANEATHTHNFTLHVTGEAEQPCKVVDPASTNPDCVPLTCPYCHLYFCNFHDGDHITACDANPNKICVAQGGTNPQCSICGYDLGDGTTCHRCTYHDAHNHDDDVPPEPDVECPMGPDCVRCAYMDPTTGKICGKCLTHHPHNHSVEPDPDPNDTNLPGLGAFTIKLPPNIKKIWELVTDTVFVALSSYSSLVSGTPAPPVFTFSLENPFAEYIGGGDYSFTFDFSTLPSWAVAMCGAVRLILAWMCTWIFIFRILKIFRECGN